MEIIAKLAYVDWLAIACLCCLVLLIMVTDSGALQNLRRSMAMSMLVLASLVAYVLYTTDPGDSLFFGQFASEDAQPKKKKGRQSATHNDGRKPEEDPSGPGDGDGGAGEEVKITIGGPDMQDGQGLPGGAKQNQKKKTGGGADGDMLISAEAKDGGGDDGQEEAMAEPAAEDIGVAQMLIKRDCPLCPSLAIVPAGSIELGAKPGQPGYSPHEGPARRVTIRRPFWLGRTEVTRAEFAYFLSESGYRPTKGCVVRERFRRDYGFHQTGIEQTDDHPAVCVSYIDAKAYVAWLSKRTGLSYRLPREVEWEYAARAGSTANYAWGEEATAQHANFADLMPGTTPVGRYHHNGFGHRDMAGNVWELVEDCWSSDRWAMERELTGENAKRAQRKKCDQRVMKGGAWYSDGRHLRPAARWPNPTATGGNGVGFRVARDIERVKAGTTAVRVQPDEAPDAQPVSSEPVRPALPAPAPAGDPPREAIVPAATQPRAGEPARTQRRVERPLKDAPPKTAVKAQTAKKRASAPAAAVR